MKPVANAYAKAGVDIEAGYEVVERIKRHVKKMERLGMMGAVGGSSDCLDSLIFQLKEPVLASGADGVGTELAVAIKTDKHDTIGIDCVAMYVNDILTQGTKLLYFLDYLATKKNNPARLEGVIEGVTGGRVQGDIALIGGETTEISGMYSRDGYDLAGFTVGVTKKSQLLTGETINLGDMLLGIASSGIHSNGYSLARKISSEQQQSSLSSKLPELKKTLGGVLLGPTKIYVSSLLPLIKKKKIKEAARIIGGRFVENVPRMLPESMAAEVKSSTWSILPISGCLQKYGEIPMMKMYEIFNIDIGMVLAVEEVKAREIIRKIEQASERVYKIGKVIAKEKHCVVFAGEGR